MITMQRIADFLRRLAADVRECHSFNGEWEINDPADQVAKDEHDEAIRLADELDGMDMIIGANAAFWERELDRLRLIERAATHAYNLAKSGEALLAFDALSTALEPK